MEQNSKPLSTLWKVLCSLVFVTGVSTCIFSPREQPTNGSSGDGVEDSGATPRTRHLFRARAVLSGVTGTGIDADHAPLREFQGKRPDGGSYVAYSREKVETFPFATTVFILDPPLDHDAQVMMIYTAIRDAYGISSDALNGPNNPFRLETFPIGKALAVDDEQFTYIVFSARVSDEDRRWGAVTVWRKVR
jgi:hypothetical protein